MLKMYSRKVVFEIIYGHGRILCVIHTTHSSLKGLLSESLKNSYVTV